MPSLLDTQTRTDALVEAMNHLVVSEGIPGLTLRKIARASGVSPGSMLHHLGSKAHLLRIGAHRTGKALRLQVRSYREVRGMGAFLPSDPDELRLARAWLAWVELARGYLEIERVVAGSRDDERSLISVVLGARYTSDDTVIALALVEGLRAATCAPLNPLPMAQAQSLLIEHLAGDRPAA